MKKWREKNKDKVKASQKRYWEKKYKEIIKEAQGCRKILFRYKSNLVVTNG